MVLPCQAQPSCADSPFSDYSLTQLTWATALKTWMQDHRRPLAHIVLVGRTHLRLIVQPTFPWPPSTLFLALRAESVRYVKITGISLIIWTWTTKYVMLLKTVSCRICLCNLYLSPFLWSYFAAFHASTIQLQLSLWRSLLMCSHIMYLHARRNWQTYSVECKYMITT